MFEADNAGQTDDTQLFRGERLLAFSGHSPCPPEIRIVTKKFPKQTQSKPIC
jgi:hypothetical protein